MKALEGKKRCVAFWQPAHGKSHAPDQDFTMDDWVDWLISGMDELNIKKAVICGHSMGGMLTMNAVLKYPERFKAMILVGTQDSAWDEEKNEGFLMAVDMVSVGWGTELAPQVADLLMGESFLKREPSWIGTWTNEVSEYDLTGMSKLGPAICGRKDVSDKIGEIGIPALVVHGTLDKGIEINY